MASACEKDAMELEELEEKVYGEVEGEKEKKRLEVGDCMK